MNLGDIRGAIANCLDSADRVALRIVSRGFSAVIQPSADKDYTMCQMVLRGYLPVLRDIFTVANIPAQPRLKMMKAAVYSGRRDIIRWIGQDTLNELSPASLMYLFEVSIREGRLKIVKLLYSLGLDKKAKSNFYVNPAALAITYSQLDILKWMHAAGHTRNLDERNGYNQCNLATHKWLRQVGIMYAKTMASGICAAKNGDLRLLKWLYTNGHPIGMGTMSVAAHAGYMHIMQWLHEVGIPRDGNIVVNDVRILKWLEARGYYRGGSGIIYSILMSCSLPVFKYVVGHRGNIPPDAFSILLARGQIDILEYALTKGAVIPDNAVNIAIHRDSVETIRWLESKGHPPPADICKQALTRESYKSFGYFRGRFGPTCPGDYDEYLDIIRRNRAVYEEEFISVWYGNERNFAAIRECDELIASLSAEKARL